MKRMLCLLLAILTLLLAGCFGGGNAETEPLGGEPQTGSTEEIQSPLPPDVTEPDAGTVQTEPGKEPTQVSEEPATEPEETEEYIPPTPGENETPIG